MHRATILTIVLALLGVGSAFAQQTDYVFSFPTSEEFQDPYTVGLQSGARTVNGPYDLDGDGNVEVLVTDYTGGGRTHVIENAGANTWELVYSTPWNDSTATSQNSRTAVGGDLDGDGFGEIIYLSGRGYSETNPNADQFTEGLFVYEHTGADNDYGAFPASIYDFGGDLADRWVNEMMSVEDIDGDGSQELMIPNNAGGSDNEHDNWYILSVTGDIGGGFEVWVEEARLSSRASESFDPVNRGGGSPYAIHPADLDGDGAYELSLHSWNSFNFTNGQVTGPNLYEFPEDGAANAFLQAAPSDHVSLFAGTVVDINQDGDDEVFYPRFQSSSDGLVSVLNYEDGEDVLQVTTDNLIFDLIGSLTNFGLTAGDMDDDGNLELIGAGPSLSGAAYTAGERSTYVNIAEFIGGQGGDPEVASNYEVTTVNTSLPTDTLGYDIVYRDSAGVTTKFFETHGGPIFPAKIAYLGDADDDGEREVAVSFQGNDDSLSVFDEVWNPDSLTGAFNTPVGADDPGPIGPGQAYEFTVDAAPGSHLSFATMFVPSNDLFYAPADSGLALFNEDGTQRSGDVTSEIMLWDAGTEENQEPGNGDNQAPNQDAPNTGPDDPDDTVRLVDDGFTYPAVADVIQVTLTPSDDSDTQFTVRIENVSTETTLNGDSAVPLAPGVSVVHGDTDRPLFTEGQPEPGDGLEALAEDGNPATLHETLQNRFGFFRTTRETVAVEQRAFMRVIASDGLTVKIEDEMVVVPSDYKLHANYPNPFNPSTTIRFTLPLDKRISVRVYDVTGRLIDTLVDDEFYTEGTHQVTWNGTSSTGSRVASGTYIYTLEYGNFRQSRKMLLVK